MKGSKPVNKPIVKLHQNKPESYTPKTPEILSLAEEMLHQIDFPCEYILPDKSTKIPPGIKHYGPAYVPFANEFSLYLEYTGQGYGLMYNEDWVTDRSYVIADIISGHAMEPSPLFSKKNVDYLWKTVGFTSYSTFYADSNNSNYMSEQDMKEMMKHSLFTLNRPVIMPQDSQWWGSIVIGYKDNGNVLLIYHYLPYFMEMKNNAQPKTEEISNWYNDNTSLAIVGKREKLLTLKDIFEEGLTRIRNCLETNIHGEKRRYYDEWETFLRMSKGEMIAEVRRIGIVPGGEHGSFDEKMKNDEEVWRFICGAHNSTWCNMAERRFYVANFVRQAKEYFPKLEDSLKALDDHFIYTNRIMGNEYGKEVGDPVDLEIFSKPDVRERMADCVKRFREADKKGLEMVEKLLESYAPKMPEILLMAENAAETLELPKEFSVT